MSKADSSGLILPKYTKEDAYAVQALAAGSASPGQQQRVVKWLFEQAARVDDLSFRPGQDGDRATAFAEGRRFVGLQFAKLMNLKSEILENMSNG